MGNINTELIISLKSGETNIVPHVTHEDIFQYLIMSKTLIFKSENSNVSTYV